MLTSTDGDRNTTYYSYDGNQLTGTVVKDASGNIININDAGGEKKPEDNGPTS